MVVTVATSQVVFLFFLLHHMTAPPHRSKAVEPAGADLPCSATTCSSQQERSAPSAERIPGKRFISHTLQLRFRLLLPSEVIHCRVQEG